MSGSNTKIDYFATIEAQPRVPIFGQSLICSDRCNVTYNYNTQNNITVNNTGKTLTIDYRNGGSVLFNGNDSYGNQNDQYTLKEMNFMLPSHNVTVPANDNVIGATSSVQNILSSGGNGSNSDTPQIPTSSLIQYPIQMNLVHESADGERFLVISQMMNVSDSLDSQKTNIWKFFNLLTNNFPLKGKSKTINLTGPNVVQLQNLNNVLPKNRSFYNFISSNIVAWIVFKEIGSIPSAFFKQYANVIIGQPMANTYINEMNNIKVTAPPSKFAIKRIFTSDVQPIDDIKDVKVNENITQDNQDKSKDDKKTKKTDDVKSIQSNGSKLKSWQIALIVIGSILGALLIGYLVYHMSRGATSKTVVELEPIKGKGKNGTGNEFEMANLSGLQQRAQKLLAQTQNAISRGTNRIGNALNTATANANKTEVISVNNTSGKPSNSPKTIVERIVERSNPIQNGGRRYHKTK